MAIGDASGRGRAMTQPHIVNDSDEAVEEERVLRWGGAAGVLGSVMLLGAFIVVGALGLPDTSDTASLVDFPDIETARIVENTLYLGALLLWTLHFIALRLALRRASLAPSLFGSALGIFGLVILAAGALLHVATGMLSDLYHSSTATAADQATLVVAWQGAQSVLDTLFITGALVAPVGVLMLGTAMLRSSRFGPAVGWLSIVLGAGGVIGAAVGLVDPASAVPAASILGMVIFHLVVGWKSYRRANG
jgi:hypothetical protein